MSFPRYPAYKDSGVEWLGEVPAHWDIARLGSLTSKIGSGKTPGGGADVYSEDGVLFLRSQNVHDAGLALEDVVYITSEIDAEMSGSRVRPGDILLNITGASLGRSCLVPDRFPPANVNQHVCIIRLSNPALSPFVSAMMKSAAMKAQFAASQNGAAREGLNYAQIAGLVLPIPPADEQVDIVRFLTEESKCETTLIELFRSVIELLAEKRQAVISHAVTKGLDPHVAMKPSGVEWLGDVPAHWQIRKLSRAFASIGSGTTPRSDAREYFDDGDIPWINTGDLNDGYLVDCEKRVTELALEDYPSLKTHPKGSLAIAMYGATIGKVAITRFDATVNQACCVFSGGESVTEEFLLYAFVGLRKHLVSLATGGGQPNISQEILRNFRIAAPDVRAQQRIVEHLTSFVNDSDALISKAHAAIALLQERRSALISAAVTGKIDVRGLAGDAEREAEAA